MQQELRVRPNRRTYEKKPCLITFISPISTKTDKASSFSIACEMCIATYHLTVSLENILILLIYGEKLSAKTD